MYFESHAHYDDKRFDRDRDELLGKVLPAAGVETVIHAGCDIESTRFGIKLAEQYDYIYTSVGTHPHSAEGMTDADLVEMEALCLHPKVVAVGEIGLDFYYDNSPRDIQRKRFRDQIELAKRVKLPVIIHSREAAQEVFDLLAESGLGKMTGGAIHCYTGSPEMAVKYADMGFLIGVGGIVTYENARKLLDTVEALPMDKLLIETDSPYLSPVPNRKQRNDSQNLRYICEKIGEIKQISPESVAKYTKENARKLFSLK